MVRYDLMGDVQIEAKTPWLPWELRIEKLAEMPILSLPDENFKLIIRILQDDLEVGSLNTVRKDLLKD